MMFDKFAKSSIMNKAITLFINYNILKKTNYNVIKQCFYMYFMDSCKIELYILKRRIPWILIVLKFPLKTAGI